jgi:oxygen-independent coproporphyrinogen-3 oxidase
MDKNLHKLLLKYYGPGGRYGIFPTISKWQNNLKSNQWLNDISLHYKEEDGVDLYIHIPFCESLCTFCGCNIKVSRDHSEETEYIDAILTEWELYKTKIANPKLRSLYIGGGTPTFLSPASLIKLFNGLFNNIPKHVDFHSTIESDPRFITEEQIKVLSKYNLDRVSFGVQDFNQDVLKNVNRAQEYDLVLEKTQLLREYGIREVFYDLIYGLNYQTIETISETINKLKGLNPDGIALYPLADVPWQNKAQQAFGIYKPMSTSEKLDLFICADERLKQQGFLSLGMNYYAKKNSKFIKQKKQNLLRRSASGFMPSRSNILIGLGVSAISHGPSSMIQNEKVYTKYLSQVNNGKNSVFKSHLKTERENKLQPLFEKLICNSALHKEDLKEFNLWDKCFDIFQLLENDQLIKLEKDKIQVTETGLYFVKNICQVLERQSLS